MEVDAIIWAPKVLEEQPPPTGARFAGHRYFSVESDRQFDRGHPECIGWTVLLRGDLFTVRGVDRHLPATPIRPGENIGLLVEPITVNL
jgi:hypothetical protein